MKLIVCALLGLAVFVVADKKQTGDVLLDQAAALLQAAKIALPYFRNSPEFHALRDEVTAISGLIESLQDGPDGKVAKKAEQELNKHIHSLSMLLYRLKHMHPIPVEPPKRPMPWTDAPDNGPDGEGYL
ncbi:hypothetical protein TYRP_003816 [Tyrophagus putrescentiae]|nr:hypothetical protein TYRP_003816 [Tyrophagus putrescentiae]